jgi:hypothetical protein
MVTRAVARIMVAARASKRVNPLQFKRIAGHPRAGVVREARHAVARQAAWGIVGRIGRSRSDRH